MRKIILGIFIALAVVYSVRYFQQSQDNKAKLEESTAMIEKEVRSVGKLVVTEGTFAQILTYEKSKNIFNLSVLSAKKKALIIINAKVSIGYDLRQLETTIDQDSKTITINHIPEAEIDISPDIDYYDIAQDYLNPFNETDYNTIKKRVNDLIMDKVKKSGLERNAKNRLISELSNIYLLTKSLGWTLTYKGEIIKTEQRLDALPL